MDDVDTTSSRPAMVGALILAAIVVIGVVVWLTDSIPFSEDTAELTQTLITPSPASEHLDRITPEAAMTEQETLPTADDQIAGASTSATAPTGPADWVLPGAFLLGLLGFGSCFALFRLA